MERLQILINVSAELVQEIRVKPLYRGKLPKGLSAQATRLVEMQEAERVVKLLQQARALLKEAETALGSSNDAETIGRGIAGALDTVQALLRAVAP
jgi:hypothetical protein